MIHKRISQPEPDKVWREKYEEQQTQVLPTCIFENPDTSLSGIQLRFAESARKVLEVRRLKGDTTYKFYSNDRNELLAVMVHPGDSYSQVSIFRVTYADNPKLNATPSRVMNFTTEKGIRLGLTKADIVSRLGDCYSSSDTSVNKLTINYRLQLPQDSKTRLLQRQNMPIYYADYTFKDDKLIEFEFGFEYP